MYSPMVGGTPSYRGSGQRKGGYPHVVPVVDVTERYDDKFVEQVMKPFLTTDVLCRHFSEYPQNKRTSKSYSWDFTSKKWRFLSLLIEIIFFTISLPPTTSVTTAHNTYWWSLCDIETCFVIWNSHRFTWQIFPCTIILQSNLLSVSLSNSSADKFISLYEEDLIKYDPPKKIWCQKFPFLQFYFQHFTFLFSTSLRWVFKVVFHQKPLIWETVVLKGNTLLLWKHGIWFPLSNLLQKNPVICQ